MASKRNELADPNSCLNRAAENEPLFVLRGKDRAAPAAIRAWVGERQRLGLNGSDDPKICEAKKCAALFDHYRTQLEAGTLREVRDEPTADVPPGAAVNEVRERPGAREAARWVGPRTTAGWAELREAARIAQLVTAGPASPLTDEPRKEAAALLADYFKAARNLIARPDQGGKDGAG